MQKSELLQCYVWQNSGSAVYSSMLSSRLFRSDQMAEWYRGSASGSVDLGFDTESGQTNDL